MPKVYAFDVDETLEISNGPVTLQSLIDLRIAGHIVGICGNVHVFCRNPGWQHIASFLLNLDLYPVLGFGVEKAGWMHVFKTNSFPFAEDYILVGNEHGQDNGIGFIGHSADGEQARKAGWRFIKEIDFARGAR